jgi:hypothetical protein
MNIKIHEIDEDTIAVTLPSNKVHTLGERSTIYMDKGDALDMSDAIVIKCLLEDADYYDPTQDEIDGEVAADDMKNKWSE